MKKTIKKYHLKESIKDKMKKIVIISLIIIFGALAIVGLFTIYQTRTERIENNQNIINK